MADRVKVWFDPEGDFLEVQFRNAPGYMRETGMPSWSAWTSREGFWVSAFLGSAGFERNGLGETGHLLSATVEVAGNH